LTFGLAVANILLPAKFLEEVRKGLRNKSVPALLKMLMGVFLLVLSRNLGKKNPMKKYYLGSECT
jgi:hypothetical protein